MAKKRRAMTLYELLLVVVALSLVTSLILAQCLVEKSRTPKPAPVSAWGNCTARYRGPSGWENVRAQVDALTVGMNSVTQLVLEDGRRVLVVGECTVWMDAPSQR